MTFYRPTLPNSLRGGKQLGRDLWLCGKMRKSIAIGADGREDLNVHRIYPHSSIKRASPSADAATIMIPRLFPVAVLRFGDTSKTLIPAALEHNFERSGGVPSHHLRSGNRSPK